MKLIRVGGELEVLGRHSAMKAMLEKSARMERIESAIAECADQKVLRLLNRAWWQEHFGITRRRTM